MHTKELIARHRETIKRLKADRDWFRETRFSLSISPGETTDHIIQTCDKHIEFYERVIERLRENDS